MFKTINNGQLPYRSTKFSAGLDVFANEDTIINPGETCLVRLGICLDRHSQIYQGLDQEKVYLELHPRSSLRAKGIGGGVGIIDIDFLGEIKMVVTKPAGTDNNLSYPIKCGDKIGQMVLKRHEWSVLTEEYTKAKERKGGFGSTNV